VFPKVYTSYSDSIHPDTPVCVRGTVTCRENEEPKILVDQMLLLIDNDVYRDVPTASAPAPTSEQQAKPSAVPSKQQPTRQSVQGKVGKLYLRLPNSHGYSYLKAVNLVEIFPGTTPVVFYDGETKAYRAWRGGITLTDYLMNEFVRLLGEKNVIFK
jgi:hypothetical protein